MNPNPTRPRGQGAEAPRRAPARRLVRAAPAHTQYTRSQARRSVPVRTPCRPIITRRLQEPMNAHERGMAAAVNVTLWASMAGFLFAHREALMVAAQSLRAGLGLA